MIQWISFSHGLFCCRNTESKTAIFGGSTPNLKGIKYVNLSSCHNHLLTIKFEQNRWFELHHLLPCSAWFSHGHTRLQSVLIFSILYHPCSFTINWYVFDVFFYIYISKLLFSDSLQLKARLIRHIFAVSNWTRWIKFDRNSPLAFLSHARLLSDKCDTDLIIEFLSCGI